MAGVLQIVLRPRYHFRAQFAFAAGALGVARKRCVPIPIDRRRQAAQVGDRVAGIEQARFARVQHALPIGRVRGLIQHRDDIVLPVHQMILLIFAKRADRFHLFRLHFRQQIVDFVEFRTLGRIVVPAAEHQSIVFARAAFGLL